MYELISRVAIDVINTHVDFTNRHAMLILLIKTE